MATYKINEEFNGIEISFDSKPGEITRSALKEAGFRWHKMKKVWYARQSAERLELARKLTDGRAEVGEIVKAEGKAKEAAAALTVEKLNAIKEGYTFRETGEGLYAGWTGCNNAPIYGQELKKAIIAELKKNGIKATAREHRGGYTDSFTFTITVPEAFRVSKDEYIAAEMEKPNFGRAWWYDKNGASVHCDKLWNMSAEEREAIQRETYRREYEYAEANRDAATVLPEFVSVVKMIVSSFNSDHSNCMIDYFDRGFYDRYEWKITA